TNIVYQTVFVGTNDPSITVNVSFVRRTYTNTYRTVVVQLSELTTNVATGQSSVSSVYFTDTLGSNPQRGLRVNDVYGTERPVNYSISRITPPELLNEGPGVGFDPEPANFPAEANF